MTKSPLLETSSQLNDYRLTNFFFATIVGGESVAQRKYALPFNPRSYTGCHDTDQFQDNEECFQDPESNSKL
jgi:hypothetical protein